MNLPVRRASVLPEAPVAPLERRSGVLWVTVGSALGEVWWYPPKAATFERVGTNMVANDADINFGLSPWDRTVELRCAAAGPEPDDMRIICLLDNRPLVLPPRAIMVFARHGLTVSFEPPFTVPVP
jgi:hypothetical protein